MDWVDQITVKECCNEDAQCAFVVDKILEARSDGSSAKCSYGNFAVLYRRQVKLLSFFALISNKQYLTQVKVLRPFKILLVHSHVCR